MRTTEQKLAFVLGAISFAYGFHNAKQVAKRRQEYHEKEKLKLENDKSKSSKKYVMKIPPAPTSWVDHPMFAWLLDNLNAVVGAYISVRLRMMWSDTDSKILIFLRYVSINIIGEETALLYFNFVDKFIYNHIPYFSNKWKKQSWKDTFSDFCKGNLPNIFLLSFLDTMTHKSSLHTPFFPTNFRPLMFLLRLSVMRIITDLMFYIGHYIIHYRQLYFLHKKHHEHNTVRLSTNYHFSSLDFLIEAVFPLLVSLVTIDKLGLKGGKDVSIYEQSMLIRYIFQLEMLSHIGKPVPLMATIPPLSMWTIKYDEWNSWFHAQHHMILKCNYSITPYWDWIFGTLHL